MYFPTPNAPAESMVFEEEGGYTLSLNARFLPYRPVRIEGRQRAEFTWYPGSPEATVQMLGPEEGVIRLNGFWKDKFFEPTSISVTTSAPVAGALPAANLVYNVASLVQLVDDMRRMGRRITLSWSGLVRVGHITAFAQTWHNVHDCEWELEFSVLSQGEQTVPSVDAVEYTLPDIYAQALKLAVDLQAKIAEDIRLPQWVALTSKASLALEAANLLLVGAAGTIQSTVQGFASGVFSVSQGGRRILSTVRGAARNMRTQALAIKDQALSEYYSYGKWGDQDNTPIGAQLAAEQTRRQIGDSARNAAYSYAATSQALVRQQVGQDAQVQTYVPRVNEDLRDVSLRYYGTANYWQNLMQYNNLTTSRLTVGQTISIPPITFFSDRNSTRSG